MRWQSPAPPPQDCCDIRLCVNILNPMVGGSQFRLLPTMLVACVFMYDCSAQHSGLAWCGSCLYLTLFAAFSNYGTYNAYIMKFRRYSIWEQITGQMALHTGMLQGRRQVPGQLALHVGILHEVPKPRRKGHSKVWPVQALSESLLLQTA